MCRVAVRWRNPVGMRRYYGPASWQRRVSSVAVDYVSESTCVIAAAVDDLSDVPVHRQSRVQCDTKQLDTVSRNGTTVPATSMPLPVVILSRWTLVPNRITSVLVGLRSNPFSRNQQVETSSAHNDSDLRTRHHLVERPCRCSC